MHDAAYFNHHTEIADNRWDRRVFVRDWWRFYENDPQWVPPFYPRLKEAIAGEERHVSRLQPLPLQMEALRRRVLRRTAQTSEFGLSSIGAEWSRPVGATIVLRHPRQPRGAAYLGLLRCANDASTLRRLLEKAAEHAAERSFIGPTHLSPYLGAGALANHWNLLPPQHTPYNPPYFSEILAEVMAPATTSELYHLEVPETTAIEAIEPDASITLRPLDVMRLAQALLPLFSAACAPWRDFPSPDAVEVEFILHWLRALPLFGRLALVEDKPVGFVLLQPDLAPLFRRANGGRNLLWRFWLRRAMSRPASRGRLLFGAVLPAWRGQGIGSRLLAAALADSRQLGWQRLIIGPIPRGTEAQEFLEKRGAHSKQRYQLYQWSAPAARWY